MLDDMIFSFLVQNYTIIFNSTLPEVSQTFSFVSDSSLLAHRIKIKNYHLEILKFHFELSLWKLYSARVGIESEAE